MRLLLAWLLCLIAMASVAEEMNVISGDRTIVSSDCIGSNATPQCLADTAMACGAWSLGPDESASGEAEDDPNCLAPWLNYRSASQVLPGPTRMWLQTYLVDFWVLGEADIWHRARTGPDAWHAGDMAADFYIAGCVPEKSCLQQISAQTDLQTVLAQCPRTRCIGSPRISWNSDGNGLHLFEPTATLILRQTASGWEVVDWYLGVTSTGSLGDFWEPKRWQRLQ